jgi:hypothetical protein
MGLRVKKVVRKSLPSSIQRSRGEMKGRSLTRHRKPETRQIDQLSLNETRAALDMFRTALKLTRTVLSALDHQGKEVRKHLIRLLDEVESEFEEGLCLPQERTESWFKFNLELLKKRLAEIEVEIAGIKQAKGPK